MEIVCRWRNGTVGEKKRRDVEVELMTTRVLFAEALITEQFAIWPHVFLKHRVKEHLLKCFQVVLWKKRSWQATQYTEKVG